MLAAHHRHKPRPIIKFHQRTTYGSRDMLWKQNYTTHRKVTTLCLFLN